MMMEDLMHTSFVGLERRRGDKKRRFLNTGYSALQYHDLISCCLSTGKWEEELRGSCSVQVVQVFLFYFSPESVPFSGTSECLWYLFPRCEVEVLWEKEQDCKQVQQQLMSWLERVHMQLRRENVLADKVVGSCSYVCSCSALGGMALPCGGWGGWQHLQVGFHPPPQKKHLLLQLEQELIVYRQCWKKMWNRGIMTTQHEQPESPTVQLGCSLGTQ